MPRNKLVTRSITINLRAAEELVVNKIIENGLEISEILRGLIREYGKENFPELPAYVQIQKEKLELKKLVIKDKLVSNRDYAKNTLKAVVSGSYAYFTTPSTMFEEVPLSKVKNMIPGENQIVDTHLAILTNKKFKPMGWGHEMSEESMAEARRKLEQLEKEIGGLTEDIKKEDSQEEENAS